MFRWYTEAQLCYAFLSDLPDESAGWNEQFGHSLWFTRAWTLQELLAPCAVEFYAVDWSPIGTRQSRCREISSITGIAPVALTASWMYVKDTFLTAQKLSWAAHRQASRGEDAAYSLLGLFDVNMPMLYGEGEHRAFSRLQKAIYKKDGDHSLFLFRPRLESHTVPLLAESISGFCQRQKCDLCSSDGRGQSAYHNFPYSTLKITRNLHGTIESDHFIKLVRDGVMIKLPTTGFREIPTHHFSNLASEVPSYPDTEFGADLVLAVLNVSYPGQGTVVIPLRLHGSGTYERQRMWPILLRPSFDPTGAQCLPIMVRQPNSGIAGTPVRTILRVRSSSDLVKSWTCTNLNRYLPGLGEYAIVGEQETTAVTLELQNIGASKTSLSCVCRLERSSYSGSLELAEAQLTNETPSCERGRLLLPQTNPGRRLGDQIVFFLSDKNSLRVAIRCFGPSSSMEYADFLNYWVDVEAK
jgi:hypothetical protein